MIFYLLKISIIDRVLESLFDSSESKKKKPMSSFITHIPVLQAAIMKGAKRVMKTVDR